MTKQQTFNIAAEHLRGNDNPRVISCFLPPDQYDESYEDEPATQEICRSLLADNGHDPELVEELQYVADNPPDDRGWRLIKLAQDYELEFDGWKWMEESK